MRKPTSILLVLGLVSGVTLAAVYPTFSSLDTNHDGKLSKAEVANTGINFKTADKNKNGSLSKAEYKAAVAAMSKTSKKSNQS